MTTSKKTSPKKLVQPVREVGAARDYPALLAEVKARIQSAQYTALRAVNKELDGLYWDIGRLIVERQQREGRGKSVVTQLVADPQAGLFWERGLFGLKPVAHEKFFRDLARCGKTRTTGARNWLGA